MFNIEIGGMNLLYTGDYSLLADRHLSAADIPDTQPDIGLPIAPLLDDMQGSLLCCAPVPWQSTSSNYLQRHGSLLTKFQSLIL